MLDFLASLAKSVSDAVKLALSAVLRLFGQQPGPTTQGTPSTRPGGPAGMVTKSVPDYQERAAPTSDLEASAPPPVTREPEPEPSFSPAPAPEDSAPEAPESPAPAPEASAPSSASSEPEPDTPFSPAPAPVSAGPRAPESSAPAPEASAASPTSSESEPDAPFSPAPAPVSAAPRAPQSSAFAPEAHAPPPASSAPEAEAPSSPAPAPESLGSSAPESSTPAPEASALEMTMAESEISMAEPDDSAGAGLEEMSGAEPGDAPDEAPAPEPEPVLLGASAPKRARPGDVILAQFTAYVKGFEEQARGELAPASTSTQVELGVETDCRWPVGTRVTARCSAKGFAMEPMSETFVWDGECRTVSFDIEVPADAQPRSTVLLMEAFVHDRGDAPDAVQVGRLRMPLEIGDAEDDDEPQRVKMEAPRTAFASYASADRLDVLERASSIRRSAGIEVKVDVLFLEMGEQWNQGLLEEIEACDKLLLFWSEHTPRSRWVEWEWKHAVQVKGEDVLELHLLRHTPIDQVPEELRKYHFNDVYIMARDAELYRREQAAKAAAANTPAAGG
jgi:hypothetical protein